jgi:P27 family predicted phage terminase small subunit
MESDRPECPPHLTGDAREEWDRTIEVMEKAGTLKSADRGLIALRAQAWARWMKAEAALTKSSEIVKAPKTGVPQYNVWLNVSNKAFDQVKALSFELGLSPNSRAKIGKQETDATDEGIKF